MGRHFEQILQCNIHLQDSSPGKLIFKTDMMTYREDVKNYYARAKDALQTPEELRDFFTALNKVFCCKSISLNPFPKF